MGTHPARRVQLAQQRINGVLCVTDILLVQGQSCGPVVDGRVELVHLADQARQRGGGEQVCVS